MNVASATEIAASVRGGERRAADVVGESFDRIGEDPFNAFTALDVEGATARARSIDARIAAGDDPGPLSGVPVGLKDLIDQRDHVTTAGSSFFRKRADRSASCVERLEAAGAIIIGRTGLHEFAFGFSSENPHFGPVRNPWDPGTSPGGSSGGSAAAVAAGYVPVAIGTDTGGSVRVPAALCGVMGLKVTHGLVPLTGVFPLAPSLDTVGPLARSIDDLRVTTAVMAGIDPSDPWSRRASPPRAAPVRRIGLPRHWLNEAPLSDAVASAFDQTLARFDEAGLTVVEIDEPKVAPSAMIDALAYGEVAPIHRAWYEEHRDAYGEEVAQRLDVVYGIGLDDHIAAREWRSGLQGATERVFDEVDIIVTPATCVTVKPIGNETVPTKHGPAPYRRALAWFTALVNSMGCPALVAPLAGTDRPPVGLQLIGPWWAEERVLTFADHAREHGILAAAEPAPPDESG